MIQNYGVVLRDLLASHKRTERLADIFFYWPPPFSRSVCFGRAFQNQKIFSRTGNSQDKSNRRLQNPALNLSQFYGENAPQGIVGQGTEYDCFGKPIQKLRVEKFLSCGFCGFVYVLV